MTYLSNWLQQNVDKFYQDEGLRAKFAKSAISHTERDVKTILANKSPAMAK